MLYKADKLADAINFYSCQLMLELVVTQMLPYLEGVWSPLYLHLAAPVESLLELGPAYLLFRSRLGRCPK